MFETETVKRPEVSLVITNFNGRKFLPKIIKMLEAQTYQDFEVVFVDDGSRDDSVNFMENVSFDKIVLKKQENKGVASAKRVGVLASRGKYIMFADVDDEFEPKFIETYVEAIKISRADVVFLPVYEVTANHKIRIELPDFSGFNFSTLLLTGRLQGWFCQSISYRQLWTGDLFTDGINYAEDLLAWIRMSKRNQISVFFDTKAPSMYSYIHQEKSITRTFTIQAFESQWKSVQSIMQECTSDVENGRKFGKNLLLYFYAQSLIQRDSEVIKWVEGFLLSRTVLFKFSFLEKIRIKFKLFSIRTRFRNILMEWKIIK